MIDTTAQKAEYAGNHSPAPPPYVDNGCVQAQAVGRIPTPEPLAAQLGRRLAHGSEELNNLYRAQDILIRHPEFEELLWLLHSGLV